MAELAQVPAGTAGRTEALEQTAAASQARKDGAPSDRSATLQAACPQLRASPATRPLPGRPAHAATGAAVSGLGLTTQQVGFRVPLGQLWPLQKLPPQALRDQSPSLAWRQHPPVLWGRWGLSQHGTEAQRSSAQSGLLLIPLVGLIPGARPNKFPTCASPGQRARPLKPNGQHALAGPAAQAEREAGWGSSKLHSARAHFLVPVGHAEGDILQARNKHSWGAAGNLAWKQTDHD